MNRLFIFTCLISLLLASGVNAQKKVTLIVDGFKEVKGKLMIGVYNSDSDFLKKTYKGFTADVTGTSLEYSFELPEGVYAISVYHDVNENRKLDTGKFGIPTESYGNSNNAKGFMGPPSYEKAKFTLADDMIVRINLH